MLIPWRVFLGGPTTFLVSVLGMSRAQSLLLKRRPEAWKQSTAGGCHGQEVTPPKTNMEPKNGDLEDDFPFQRDDF